MCNTRWVLQTTTTTRRQTPSSHMGPIRRPTDEATPSNDLPRALFFRTGTHFLLLDDK